MVKTMGLAIIALSIFSLFFIGNANAEVKAKLTADCDGESTFDQKKQLFELDKNVKLSYGDISLKAGWVLISIDEETKKPKSFLAKGFHKNSTDQEKATERLRISWAGYEISCRELEAEFGNNSVTPKSAIACGDVWMLLKSSSYTIHTAKADISFGESVEDAVIKLSGDSTLPKTHIIGLSFVAYEGLSTIAIKKKTLVHEGNDIEIVFDIENGSKILRSDLAKLKADKLVCSAKQFKFSPNANTYLFSKGCDLTIGELSLDCDRLELTTSGEKHKPKKISAFSSTDEKGRVEVAFGGMNLKAKNLDGNFDDKGKISIFTAKNTVEAVVIDSKDKLIEVKCEIAEYTGDIVTLTPKEGEKVLIECKEEKWRGTATWVKFIRTKKRWDVQKFEPHIEIDIE